MLRATHQCTASLDVLRVGLCDFAPPAIVRALAMASKLNLQVIAEGVESED